VTLPKVGEPYRRLSLDQNPERRENLPAFNTYETRYVTQAELDKIKNQNSAGPLTSIDKVFEPSAPAVREVPAAAPRLNAGQPGALPASGPAVQAPQGGLSTGYNMLAGIPIMPPNPAFMSQKEYVAMNRNDPSKSLAELLAKGAELEKQRYEKTDAGIVDYKTGYFNPLASGQTEDTPIFGPGFDGKLYKIPKNIAMMLTHLGNLSNWDAYKALADRATGRTFGQPAGSPPVTGGSVEDRALAAKQTEALAAASTAQEIEDRKNFVQRGRDADDQITLASQFRKFASDPNAGKMVGILNNDKVSSAVAKAVESGIGSRNYRIGIPEIQEIMRNADLSPTDQATYRTFLMLVVNSQLQKTKYLKGSISNYEDQLLASAGINAQDTVETIRIKSDLMTRGAQFDRLVAKTFKASKMTADEFLDSDKYSQLRDKYNSDMSELSFGGKTLAPEQAAQRNPSQGAAPSGTPPVLTGIKAAQEKVRKELEKK
jgi:hypothetical protein